MKSATIFSVIVVMLFLTACKLEGRLYNLSTGQITPVYFTYSGSGKGKLFAVLPSGEKVSGEYVTFTHPPVNWGTIYASVYGGGWSGGESGPPHNQYGTAVASTNNGFVADND